MLNRVQTTQAGKRILIMEQQINGSTRYIDHYEFVNWMIILAHLKNASEYWKRAGKYQQRARAFIEREGVVEKARLKHTLPSISELSKSIVTFRIENPSGKRLYSYGARVIGYIQALAHEELIEYTEAIDPSTGGAGTRTITTITKKGIKFYENNKRLANQLIEKYPNVTY